jgi:hypothetical protein
LAHRVLQNKKFNKHKLFHFLTNPKTAIT